MDELVRVFSVQPANWTPEEMLAREQQCLEDIAQRIAALEKCFLNPIDQKYYQHGLQLSTFKLPDGKKFSTSDVGALTVYTARLNSLYSQQTATQNRIIEWQHRKVSEQGSGI